ncbi:MAG: MFS transporter [Propionicimonas sp.]|uniref:MFS transporter n=1 Tax=Propionicimonas sp. TaxID=1955623 RepID=UPI002B2020A1|nr:MFS transporter [Propionicimonas sp.]MEA4945013.1 MFS transporter [Propionicimonas sp.]
MTTNPTAPTRAERLDRLPFGRQHRRLLVGSGVGWALDAMDVGLISFVMAALRQQWNLDATQLSWIGSIGFVGMALGATLGGLLADRVGRRQTFALTLLVYGLATGAAALSTSVAMLIALRFLVGLGLGAELPVASTLVSEFAPRRIRGRMVVALEAFWAVGWLMAALIGYVIVPAADNGWRWALAVGILPTVYAAVVRWGLPESVRYLELKGRHAEAEAAVQAFERGSEVEPRATGATDAVEAEPVSGEGEPARSIWSREYRGRTAALWAVWFCINLSYYGAFIWIPTLLVGRGFDLVQSFEYTLIITLAQLPGYAAAAWLIEVWGRRVTLAVFLAGSAVSAVLFGLAGAPGAIIAAGCALSFFNLGAWGALYAVGPELYPTPVRGTGTGAAAAFGRIASIIAPLLVPVLLPLGGEVLVFGLFGVVFVLAATAALALPEITGRPLDDDTEALAGTQG